MNTIKTNAKTALTGFLIAALDLNEKWSYEMWEGSKQDDNTFLDKNFPFYKSFEEIINDSFDWAKSFGIESVPPVTPSKTLPEALENFGKKSNELLLNWDDGLNNGYPLEKPFADINAAIQIWIETHKENNV